MIFGALLFLLTGALFAQDELSLRRFFEGKQVRVKLDMPATHEGVDYHYRQDPPLDLRAYSARIRRHGAALHNGDPVMITAVRVKGKNIEFQLGGGGYGVFGDDSGSVTASTVSKSSREKQLEKDLDNEKDSARRDRMRRDLDRLRGERQREESRARDRARELEAIKKREIAAKRLQAGSRFNLWFPEGYLRESTPTPKDIMAMLSEWVDFGTVR